MSETTTPEAPKRERPIRREVNFIPSDIVDGAQMPRLLGTVVAKSDMTTQVPDPFSSFYGGANGADGCPQIIEPTYNMDDLAQLPNMNSTLAPCIDAMVVNTAMTGFTLIYKGKEGKQGSGPAQNEKHRIMALLDYPNPDEPFILINEKLRKDYESTGWAALEVIRDQHGKISSFYHIPSSTLRMTVKDVNVTLVKGYRWIDGELQGYLSKKRFRRYVQVVGGNQKVYFKEFLDPRPISVRDGSVTSKATPTEELANEIIIFSQFTPGHNYALPRHINQIPAILGSREAELTNLHFFKDNAIPAMAILVSGGYLTDDTMRRLSERFRQNRGRKGFNKILIIEAAISDEDKEQSDTAVEHPRLEFKALSQDRQQDALFMDYDKANADKIRSAYRLPPIFIGLTSDYTRATATASLELGENQVFAPERAKFDAIFNTTILMDVDKPAKFWTMRSNGSKIVGATTISETLMRLEKVGACTPNVAIQLARSFLNLDIEEVNEEWGDMPFEFSKALLKNGNMGLKGEFIPNSLRHPASIPDEQAGKPDNDMGFGKKTDLDEDEELGDFLAQKIQTYLEEHGFKPTKQ